MANVYIDAKDDHKKDEEQVEVEEEVEETCECEEETADESCECEDESCECEDESCECEDESCECDEEAEEAEDDSEEESEDKKEFDYKVYGKETVDETKKMAEKMINDVVSTLKSKQDDWNKTFAEYKSNKPPVDLLEYEDELVIKMDIPRVSKDDIDVKMSSEAVEIEVTFPELEPEEGVKVLRSERCSGLTKNVVVLPVEVDIQEVKASFEDQLLTITLPKIKGKKVDVEIV